MNWFSRYLTITGRFVVIDGEKVSIYCEWLAICVTLYMSALYMKIFTYPSKMVYAGFRLYQRAKL